MKVVHCQKSPYDVLIDRTTKWGNPFRIGVDGDRKEVLEKYENHLRNNPQLLKDIMELDGKILGCWCSPENCHGDIIIRYINLRKWEFIVNPLVGF